MNYVESLRKQLEEASAAEKTVPSSGANNVTWSKPSSTFDLNRIALSQPHQPTTILPQHGTVPISGLSLYDHGAWGSLVHNQQGSQGHLIRYPHLLCYHLLHSVQDYRVLYVLLIL